MHSGVFENSRNPHFGMRAGLFKALFNTRCTTLPVHLILATLCRMLSFKIVVLTVCVCVFSRLVHRDTDDRMSSSAVVADDVVRRDVCSAQAS